METLKDRVNRLCDKIYTEGPFITKKEMEEEIEAALISERDSTSKKWFKVMKEAIEILHHDSDKFESIMESILKSGLEEHRPKILTAKQWRDSDESHLIKNWEEYFNAGDLNGQKREWFREQQVELRNATLELIANSDDDLGPIYPRIEKALENLKPPFWTDK